MSKAPPPEGFDENPEWTVETSARAYPPEEVLPPQAVAALAAKRPIGRPPGSDKGRTAIRLDNDVLAYFKAGGRGWQTRINEALRKVAGL